MMKLLRGLVLIQTLLFCSYSSFANVDTLRTYAKCLIEQVSLRDKSETLNSCIAQEALEIGYTISDDSIIAASLCVFAYILRQSGDAIPAIDSAYKAESYFKSYGDTLGLADVYNIIGLCYYSEGNLAQSIDYFHRSILYSYKIGDNRLIANSLLNVGLANLNVHNYAEAKRDLLQSIEFYSKQSDSAAIAKCYENLGLICSYQNDFKNAQNYNFSALRIYKETNSVNLFPSVYDNIGFAYEGMGELKKAIEYYKKCVKSSQQTKSSFYEAFGRVDLGRAQMLNGEYTQSQINLQRGLEMALEQNSGEIIYEAYNALSEYYLRVGLPYRSREMLLEYIDYYKKSFNASTSKHLQSLQVQLDHINKERETDILRSKLEMEQIKAKQAERLHSAYAVSIILLVVLIFLMVLFMANNSRRTKREKAVNKQLADLNEELETKVESRTHELQLALNRVHELERVKNAFLNNISHEIRTPLNGILGFARFLVDGELTTTEKNEYGRYIARLGTRLLRILDDVLELSKIETNQLDVHVDDCNVNSLIDLLYENYISLDEVKEKNLHLTVQKALPDVGAFFRVDRVRLGRIMEKLIDNAIKFTQEGSIEFGYFIDDSQTLRFYVKDTGIGIPASAHKHIFERFYRHHDQGKGIQYEGTGVGLTIAKGFAFAMGGRIELESEQEKGSTFYLILPQVQVIDKWGAFLKDKTILVVEDDIVTCQYLETIIKSKGARLLVAKNAEDAIEICSLSVPIDAVLLNIQLPFMNGYETASKLKQINPKLPIIAQSAMVNGNEALLSNEVGCDAFIAKPIDSEELYSILYKLIGRA